MDVPAATGGQALTPIPSPQPAPSPAPVAVAAPTPAPIVFAGTGSGGAGTSSSGATAATRSLSGTPQSAPGSNQRSDTTLTPVVAKLFNASAQNVQVSFQVSTDPDEVVTVFTDRSTGKEIIQFPSQALIALAQMYDKDAGKVLDKSV
jgi:uncharacterized FlaG/YvyC family protein